MISESLHFLKKTARSCCTCAALNEIHLALPAEDISIGGKGGGRVIFELFADLTPRTAENFRGFALPAAAEGPVKSRWHNKSEGAPVHYMTI